MVSVVVVCRHILMNCTTVGVGGASTLVYTSYMNCNIVGGVGGGGV